jgi:hypothetical protein
MPHDTTPETSPSAMTQRDATGDNVNENDLLIRRSWVRNPPGSLELSTSLVGGVCEKVRDDAEEWRPIPGFDYEASSLGRIRNSTTKHVLSPGDNGRGYAIVNLAGARMRYVHRLVAVAFLGPCPGDCEVDHRNATKRDNRPGNLQYVTHDANVKLHALRTAPTRNRTCSRCARTGVAVRQGLCGRCYEYRRRRGVDRPIVGISQGMPGVPRPRTGCVTAQQIPCIARDESRGGR